MRVCGFSFSENKGFWLGLQNLLSKWTGQLIEKHCYHNQERGFKYEYLLNILHNDPEICFHKHSPDHKHDFHNNNLFTVYDLSSLASQWWPRKELHELNSRADYEHLLLIVDNHIKVNPLT